MTKTEYERLHATTFIPKNISYKLPITGGHGNFRQYPLIWIASLITLSTIFVVGFGTIFFCHGMNATKGRFEVLEGV